jgi:hypothetical protein
MPPGFRVYTKKTRGGYEWGNTYAVNAANLAAAVVIAGQLAELERINTWNGVIFDGVRVSTWAQDGRTGSTYPFSGVGANTLANPLPIECCVRMQFFPGVKQANIKYFRYVLDGTSQADGVIGVPSRAALTTWANAIVAIAGVVNTGGDELTSASVDIEVGNRQLYRAWAARAGVDEGD